MRILGIDPGSSVTGYGVVERGAAGVTHCAHGTLRFSASRPHPERLAAIYDHIRQWIDETQPEVAAIEKIFVSANPRSALILGQARGAALAALSGAGVPIVEYTPQQLKSAVTGRGSAAKREVQAMVRRLLALERTPAADAADALALAICQAQAGRIAALGEPVGRRRGGRRGAGAKGWVVRRLR